MYGAVDVLSGRFNYHFAETCNTHSHQDFLEMLIRKYYPKKIFVVEDNAKFHKNPDMRSWFDAHRKNIEPWFLPPYSPEFNSMEPLWGYTRREATHNNFFADVSQLVSSIKTVFRRIQYHPEVIQNYLAPFK